MICAQLFVSFWKHIVESNLHQSSRQGWPIIQCARWVSYAQQGHLQAVRAEGRLLSGNNHNSHTNHNNNNNISLFYFFLCMCQS